MKTNEQIKEQAKVLFNEKGLKNVTLREVAKAMNKSYGNVTYHFPTKEHLLRQLYDDFNQKLQQLQQEEGNWNNLLEYFLALPAKNFEIIREYLFFYVDYVEIKRGYPAFIKQVELLNEQRKKGWLQLLLALQQQVFLDSELSEADLLYLMELSAGIRMFYFQENVGKLLDKKVFVSKVNRLLVPYLSEQGKLTYQNVMK